MMALKRAHRGVVPWRLLHAASCDRPVATQKQGHQQLAFVAADKGLRLQEPPMVSASAQVATRLRNVPHLLEDLFLPRDYQTSTTKDYLPYAKWQFVGSVAGTACGVLSMQSLLYAIGLQSGAIPMAAALNWVIKDGLGQFGGVLFASLVNHRFDSDPKRWRIVSALAMDAATLTEILTPLCPAYFLPMAAMANVAKNISWLSASATRAGFHYSFAKTENLADITAKAGSQSIASSILGGGAAHGAQFTAAVGTALGIAISPIIGTATSHVAGAFFVLSGINLWSQYNSLCVVSLRTLNQQRLNHILDNYIATGDVPTPETVSAKERFVSNLLSGKACHLTKSSLSLTSRLDTVYTPSTPRFPGEKYLLHVTGSTVHLLMEESATSADVLAAHLHTRLVQLQLETDPSVPTEPLLNTAYVKASALRRPFLEAMEASAWHCENLLVEDTPARYTLLAPPPCA
ncbi:hypothetical protein ACHHYP_13339 [Achlya hypogyna]|uniref:Protein root UVB sensitive/RUS domain-containing protein n=1 Tax=Achlya hypogyna TaxID=1202772 RepID=A0A1V9YFE1_ACHHY|nr:hypothetical protein ACHHYP_13339 [Achlya hypogyna]